MRILAIFFLVIFTGFHTQSQSLDEKLGQLQASVKKVTVKDIEYDQKLKFEKSSGYIITVTITESKKGKVTEYSFNLFDIEKNKIKFDTKKNVAIVQIGTKADKKMIKNVIDKKVSSYLNKISIMADGVESARALNNQLKAAVEEADKVQHDFFPKMTSLPELLGFLKSNLGKVQVNDDVYEQSFSFKDDNNVIVTFTTNDVNKSSSESIALNFGDINQRKIDFITRGNSVYIEAETNGKKNLIEQTKNGEISGFKNKITLRGNSIEEGRKIAAALINLKELADQNQKELYDPNSDWTATVNYLKANVKKVTRNDVVYEQSIEEHGQIDHQLIFERNEQDKDKTSKYTFNPSDLNGAKIGFSTKGTAILINCETKGKNP